MNRSLVVDASVALKWVVSEHGSDEATALLEDMAGGAVALMAPEHIIGEVGNGLRKRVAQGVLSFEDAIEALDAIAALELSYVSGSGRWFRCVHTAVDWSITTYDARYVLLAIDFDAELVTADERLVAAIPAGPVRLLGR